MVMEPFVFNFTPTGMLPTRAMTPHVPKIARPIVAAVIDAADVGVNMVHLHAREPGTGRPALSPDLYARMIRGIRSVCPDLVITVSTSGRDWPEFEKRSAVLDLDGD